MLTRVTSSLIATEASPLQLLAQIPTVGVAVGVSIAIGVSVGVSVGVSLGVGVTPSSTRLTAAICAPM